MKVPDIHRDDAYTIWVDLLILKGDRSGDGVAALHFQGQAEPGHGKEDAD